MAAYPGIVVDAPTLFDAGRPGRKTPTLYSSREDQWAGEKPAQLQTMAEAMDIRMKTLMVNSNPVCEKVLSTKEFNEGLAVRAAGMHFSTPRERREWACGQRRQCHLGNGDVNGNP